jgi:hypothetical protein
MRRALSLIRAEACPFGALPCLGSAASTNDSAPPPPPCLVPGLREPRVEEHGAWSMEHGGGQVMSRSAHSDQEAAQQSTLLCGPTSEAGGILRASLASLLSCVTAVCGRKLLHCLLLLPIHDCDITSWRGSSRAGASTPPRLCLVCCIPVRISNRSRLAWICWCELPRLLAAWGKVRGMPIASLLSPLHVQRGSGRSLDATRMLRRHTWASFFSVR